MVLLSTSPFPQKYDRKAELTAFDEAKTGVKGLVEAGITEVPRIFHIPLPQNLNSNQESHSKLCPPTIDLEGIHEDPIKRKEVIKQVKDAFETWGCFQMVNHGIPLSILEEMMEGVKRFHEDDAEVRKQWYKRNGGGKHTFYVTMAPNPPQPDELPPQCRDILLVYSSQMMKLSSCMFELISEALGLDRNHLGDIGCAEGLAVLGHYYPSCPQPELTLGTSPHSDTSLITILLQDHVGVNAGDILQLITNDQFVSAEHKIFKPIKELLSDDNPAKYGGTTVTEYVNYYRKKGLDGISSLLHFKIY
nr:1-aminocyclopropane-1-carboxylate oxidase homolog 1-like [Tanacetum cinerariifolium]